MLQSHYQCPLQGCPSPLVAGLSACMRSALRTLARQVDKWAARLLPLLPLQDETPGALPRKQILLIQRYCNRY